jgi:hypothetical protein
LLDVLKARRLNLLPTVPLLLLLLLLLPLLLLLMLLFQVGPSCIVGEDCVVGDKTSVKRSVIGNNCRCDMAC